MKIDNSNLCWECTGRGCKVCNGTGIDPEFKPKEKPKSKNKTVKTALFIFALITCVACSEETIEPSNKTQSIMETPDAQDEKTGCDAVVTNNAHANGETITIKAEYAGYAPGAVLLIETKGDNASSYRKPAAERNAVEQTVAFAAKGQTLHIGLFPCGGSAPSSGKDYTVHITQGGKTTTVKSKVGNAVEYIVTH